MGAQPIASLAPSPMAETPALLQPNPASRHEPAFTGDRVLAALLESGPWSKSQRRELSSLASETDPQLFWQTLVAFGIQLEQAELYPAAARVYAMVASRSETFRDQAQRRLDALLGEGAFGPRFEFLLQRFCRDAADPKVILPMVAGSAIYSLARTATLSRLASASSPSWFAQGWGARLSAATVGFAFEVPAFTFGARALQSAAGNPAGNWDRDLASTALSLGLLKAFGFAGQRGQRFLASPELGLAATATPAAKIPALMLGSGSSLLGLWTAHRLEIAWGLRPRRDGATDTLDTVVAWLGMGIGARWGQALLGPRLARFQTELEALAEGSVPTFEPARPAGALAMIPERPARLGPQLMAMSGGGRNGFESGNSPGHSWLGARQLVVEARQDSKALERLVQAARENPYALEQLENLARERIPGATEGLADLAKDHAPALLRLAQLANKRHRLAADLLLEIQDFTLHALDPKTRGEFHQALPLLVRAGHPRAAEVLAREAREHPDCLDWLFGLAGERKTGATEALWSLARSGQAPAVSRLATLLEIRKSELSPPDPSARRRIAAANRQRQLYAKGKLEALAALSGLAERDSYAFTQLTILAHDLGDVTARRHLMKLDLTQLAADYQPAGQRVEWLLAMAYAGNRSAKALLKTVDLAPLTQEISKRLGTRNDFSANLVGAFGTLGPFERILEKRLIPQLDVAPLTRELERHASALGNLASRPNDAAKFFRGDLEMLLYLANRGNRPARQYLRSFDTSRVPSPYAPSELILAVRQMQMGRK